MRFKRFLISFLLFATVLTETPQAIFISDSYKQGVYNISEENEFNATARLVGAPPATFIIIDSAGNEKFFKRFDNLDEVINLGFIRNGDLIIVAGKGEIAVRRS
jgi:hypothetical protein